MTTRKLILIEEGREGDEGYVTGAVRTLEEAEALVKAHAPQAVRDPERIAFWTKPERHGSWWIKAEKTISFWEPT
jgi:hypothetical protein